MKNILTFMAGLAIGTGISWVYHKNKYEEMIQEEVEELRSHMHNKKEDSTSDNETIGEEDDIIDKQEYNECMDRVGKIIKENYYTSSIKDNAIDDKKPYVVTPEDFATMPGFDTDTLYYHKDDIISNDMNEIIDNVEQLLGLSTVEIREQFGVYEDDSVYIRNMSMKCDYEILREEENYKKRIGD